jgi:hypothetical protein
MASSVLRFLDHTQRSPIVGRTPLDELSVRLTDLYLTTHNTRNRQSSALGGTRTYNLNRRAAADLALDRAATGTGLPIIYCVIITNNISWVQIAARQLSLLATPALPIAHQVQHWPKSQHKMEIPVLYWDPTTLLNYLIPSRCSSTQISLSVSL